MKPRDVRRFASPQALDAWYALEHARATELWLAVAKKNAAQDLVPYAAALDLALAWGWIDGFVGKLDDTHYALRFTPRKPKSNWSAVNVARYAELLADGRITPAGKAAFESRDRAVSEEQRAELTATDLARFRKQPAAWAFFSAQPPGYRRQAAWYVISARQEVTRARRLALLIEVSGAQQRLPAFSGGKRDATAKAAGKPALKRAAKTATKTAAMTAASKAAKPVAMQTTRRTAKRPATQPAETPERRLTQAAAKRGTTARKAKAHRSPR